ncbi:YraN family protein [Herbaspirillum seropedicae]|uniref:YraN family protein n=1 Tax=Herbaspirillum seropedicae TaxID=964 RepID=UPI000847D991|nr:YraN family protein [Herbaspirillum seropedicae]AON57070.1 Holliday junction resolvase-like protein [Herbaspirillum seropedicae]MDR6397821.1 putative endonuclease [Herbaspirillum seropedicae]
MALNASGSRTSRQRTGEAAEQQALTHLRQQGLQLLERNYRCQGGEIDLIMREGDTVVFVEVRARASASYGGAAASVTPAKQRRLILAAQRWLQAQAGTPPCRFDVVTLDGQQLQWLRNAIEA